MKSYVGKLKNDEGEDVNYVTEVLGEHIRV